MAFWRGDGSCFCQLVVAAATAGEVARTVKPSLVLNLDAAAVSGRISQLQYKLQGGQLRGRPRAYKLPRVLSGKPLNFCPFGRVPRACGSACHRSDSVAAEATNRKDRSASVATWPPIRQS